MKRVAFKMRLKDGCVEEYEKRHGEIWPEILERLKEAGVSDYSIFLDEEMLTLFAVQKIKHNIFTAELTHQQIIKRWWEYMSDLIETNDDNTPRCTPLKEVFHMD